VGGVLIAMLSGGAAAVQTRINSELSAQLGDGMLAAVISFGSGLLVLLIAVLFSPGARAGLAQLRSSVAERITPWWFLTGGLFGAVFVISQNVAAAPLGIALFTVAMVASQTVSSTVVDRIGVGDLASRPVSRLRVLAAALAVIAVVFTGLARLDVGVPLGFLILPVLAGAGIGVQQAFNGQVRFVSGSALTATAVNFLFGTIILCVVAGAHTAVAGWPAMFPADPLLYTGGLLGVVFIGGAILVVRTIGVLLTGLGTISGQLMGALAVDLLAPVSAHPVGVTTVVGTLVTLVAVSVAVASAQRPATS